MGVRENDAALVKAVDAWNAGDVDAYMQLYAPDIKLHAGTYDFPDRAAVEGMYKGFHAAGALPNCIRRTCSCRSL